MGQEATPQYSINKQQSGRGPSIPYTQAPINAKRFKAPVPSLDWTTTMQVPSTDPIYLQCTHLVIDYQTTQIGKHCHQNGTKADQREMTESCLTLNIWTPKNPNTGLISTSYSCQKNIILSFTLCFK